ncbi:MAG: acetyl-CoA carboxylase biotin carboxylase subunit [bacterium]|nr:acetyl-CoA carboxylase biotin carboxylase subunit [bacterium]
MKKVLIANRGEIALRIMNACKEMGIKTVAVYSSADKDALHTMSADEAYFIGEAPASESYLKGELIIETAHKAKCDAIHPGYGFLAENGDFAQSVIDSGLEFVGPPPKAIREMGNKTLARKIMTAAGVPVVPGTADPIKDIKKAKKTADEIGYPILIKAAGGGGGKGMRKIESPDDFDDGLKRAVSEASSSFGNPLVYIEKYLEKPRHIEFQILADKHGNTVHLFERECSIQRRHQKVIEEAPSPTLTAEERMKFGEIAVRAAEACGYSNAGTVEFLMDAHRNFYFLEMNTRIQVEHPVTEEVTGIDLVQEQFKISSGDKLGFSQNDIKLRGHSIESRIYAEDPLNDFYPSIGLIKELSEPTGNGIRIESGIKGSSEISIYYDPLIAKLVCTGQNRQGAMNRTKQALNDYVITGLKTNLAFCNFVMEHKKFRGGDFDTNFINEFFEPEYLNKFEKKEMAVLAAVAAVHAHNNGGKGRTAGKEKNARTTSNWKSVGIALSMR